MTELDKRMQEMERDLHEAWQKIGSLTAILMTKCDEKEEKERDRQQRAANQDAENASLSRMVVQQQADEIRRLRKREVELSEQLEDAKDDMKELLQEIQGMIDREREAWTSGSKRG